MLESNIDLHLPYSTSELPGTGGVLRASPEDFVVEEVPLYEAEGDGQHLYVNITKVGLTTKEVQAALERLFGLRKGDVSFAGLKDKQARTTQTFSLGVGHKPPVFAAAAQAKIEENLPVTVNWARFHRNKLKPGHLLGNRFQIRVTELGAPLEVALARAEAIVERLRERGAPNYFGVQRLGAGGANVRQGAAILRGEAGKRDRWLQRFLISAVQSYLCNRYLARRLEMGAFDRLLDGDVAKKYATGGMFDVAEAAAEQQRYAEQEISFTAPLYGPRMWAAKAEAGALEAAVLEEAGLALEDFGRVHVEGTRRMGRLLVSDLSVAAGGAASSGAASSGAASSGAGDSLVFQFMLRKGAYATTVMRELMKVDSTLLAAVEDDGGEE